MTNNLWKQNKGRNAFTAFVAFPILALVIAFGLMISVSTADAQTSATVSLTPSTTATATPTERWVIASSFGANLLACTSAECKVIKFLEDGTEVERLGSENGWFEVRIASGETGFVPDFLIARFIEMTSTPTETPVPTLTGCTPQIDWLIYIVEPGDTLSNIARRAGTTPTQLADANCISNIDFIFIGQRLRVPIFVAPQPTSILVAPQVTVINSIPKVTLTAPVPTINVPAVTAIMPLPTIMPRATLAPFPTLVLPPRARP